MNNAVRSPAFWFLVFVLVLSIVAGRKVSPTWLIEKVAIDVSTEADGMRYWMFKGEKAYLENVVSSEDSKLWKYLEHRETTLPTYEKEVVIEKGKKDERSNYYELTPKSHYGIWSLLPAFSAVGLCLLTRMPIPSLLIGIITGAFLMGRYNITDQVLVPGLSTKSAAAIVLLYL